MERLGVLILFLRRVVNVGCVVVGGDIILPVALSSVIES